MDFSYHKKLANKLLLTKSSVELLFCQVLVVINITVLQQVKQCAVGEIFGQTFLLDNLQREYIDVWLMKGNRTFWSERHHLSNQLSSTPVSDQP